MELKVGDRVKYVGRSKTPEYYTKLTSKGVVLKISGRKAFISWGKDITERWHLLRCLVKID